MWFEAEQIYDAVVFGVNRAYYVDWRFLSDTDT